MSTFTYSTQTTTITSVGEEVGYDYDFTCDQTVLQEFTCFVCRFVARRPQQVNCCGKILCSRCLEKWRRSCGQQNQSTCPHCKQKIQCFEDKKSHQKIISLSVRCTFTHHGCSWVGELQRFEAHLDACTYHVKPCPDCGEDIPKQLMKEHTMHSCPMRKVKCPYCPCYDTYKNVYGEHKDKCQFWPVECPSGCDEKIIRSMVEQHRERCQLQLVQCRYHVNGCQVMVKRNELEAHETECSRKLPGDTVLTTQQKVTKESHEKGTVAPIILQLQKFEESRQRGEVWESQPFYCHEQGYRVCLKVHTNGCLDYVGHYLACYIHLHTGHFDSSLSWPFQGVFRIGLKNQVMDDHHYIKEFKFLTCHCMPYNGQPPDTQDADINSIGQGDPQFIRFNNLSDTSRNVEYLKDNRLVFCVDYEPLEQQPYNCFQYHSINNILFR